MHRERLEVLARHLEKLPTGSRTNDTDCGTAAHALSEAAVVLRHEGFALTVKLEPGPFKGYYARHGEELFFDIPFRVAAILFSCDKYAVAPGKALSPRTVADRIRVLLILGESTFLMLDTRGLLP